MNIIACVRQTPDTETVIKINGAANGIELDGVKLVLGPYQQVLPWKRPHKSKKRMAAK